MTEAEELANAVRRELSALSRAVDAQDEAAAFNVMEGPTMSPFTEELRYLTERLKDALAKFDQVTADQTAVPKPRKWWRFGR